jgi:CDP-glycerol glycerophosphotransferase
MLRVLRATKHRIVRALAERKAIGRLYSFSRNTLVRLTSQVHRRGTVPDLLSIIVPVYDVEEYLDECLRTLRFQQYRNVEIIVVDDGSPDDSFAIARRHQLRDPRIRIIRRPNGGLSVARNTGVAAARGEFLAFADSDDTVPAAGYRAAVESLTETVEILSASCPTGGSRGDRPPGWPPSPGRAP